MATSLGGTTLAEPTYGLDGYELEHVTMGATHDLASGAVHYDYVNTRYKITLRWKVITASEKNTIRGKVEVTTSQTLVTPDGNTYTVFTVPNSWRESYIEGGDGVKYYNCEAQFEEAS